MWSREPIKVKDNILESSGKNLGGEDLSFYVTRSSELVVKYFSHPITYTFFEVRQNDQFYSVIFDKGGFFSIGSILNN